MIDKIFAEKKKRYDEVHELISDPKVIAGPSYQGLVKELSSLKPLVEEYEACVKMSVDIADLANVLAEKGHDGDFISMVEDEKRKLEEMKKSAESRLEDLLLEGGDDGDRDIIMEIRAGTGGLEASLFAGDLLRMYSKYAQKVGWKVELIDSNMTEKGGYKEVIVSISGNNVYGKMKFESGTHRVQRVPDTEGSGRIHTSAATVAVLPEAQELDLEIKPEDLRIDVYRSGGAGGQGVNKTDSAVRLTYLPTGTVVTCQDERSQLKNKSKALRVLRARLYEARAADQSKKISSQRKAQVGTGDRSEKIRTYNFPASRITDHRIGFTVHNLEEVLNGELDKIVDALKQEEKNLKLKAAKG